METKTARRTRSFEIADNNYFERREKGAKKFDSCIDLYGVKSGRKIIGYRIFARLYRHGKEVSFRMLDATVEEAMALYTLLPNKKIGYYEAFPEAIDQDEYVYGLNEDGDIDC